jgi:glycosyltransferase involved in cell wall biosynthesis
VSECTIVIPTRDRPRLIREAVESALSQTAAGTRVLVVDDGSEPPVALPDDPRLSIVRHPRPRGAAAARNLGASLATTRFVTFLDDDDRLRPWMVERSLDALRASIAPPPVAVLSGVAALDEDGSVLEVHLPPSLRARGEHFSLERIEPGRSYFCKQSLVVPRDVLLGIRGFDERFRSRVLTEFFWRLNPVCSIIGLEEVTYELRSHPGLRISGDQRLRQQSFRQLIGAHRELLRSHREGYAVLLAQHARNSRSAAQPVAAFTAALRHAWIAPSRTLNAVKELATGRRGGGEAG